MSNSKHRPRAREAMAELHAACEAYLTLFGSRNAEDYSVPVEEAVTPLGATVLRRLSDGGVEVSGVCEIALGGEAVTAQYVEVTFPTGGRDLSDSRIHIDPVEPGSYGGGTQGLRRYPELAGALMGLMP